MSTTTSFYYHLIRHHKSLGGTAREAEIRRDALDHFHLVLLDRRVRLRRPEQIKGRHLEFFVVDMLKAGASMELLEREYKALFQFLLTVRKKKAMLYQQNIQLSAILNHHTDLLQCALCKPPSPQTMTNSGVQPAD